MRKEEMRKMTIRLPNNLYSQLLEFYSKSNFSSLNELIRQAIREFLEKGDKK